MLQEFKKPDMFESLYDSDFLGEILNEIKIKQNHK